MQADSILSCVSCYHLVPTVFAGWFVLDRIVVLVTYQAHEVSRIECDRLPRSNFEYRMGFGAISIPVITTKDGLHFRLVQAENGFDSRGDWKLTVFVNHAGIPDSRIYKFSHFWAPALFFVTVAWLFGFLAPGIFKENSIQL